uniref:Uncharacterized protein n=1 Tax=Acrobeloides nanus TaxID=290746 RepID=A0A914CES0_9BILA
MEQAIKSYKSSTAEEDAEAEQTILAIPEIKNRFENYLQ